MRELLDISHFIIAAIDGDVHDTFGSCVTYGVEDGCWAITDFAVESVVDDIVDYSVREELSG